MPVSVSMDQDARLPAAAGVAQPHYVTSLRMADGRPSPWLQLPGRAEVHQCQQAHQVRLHIQVLVRADVLVAAASALAPWVQRIDELPA